MNRDEILTELRSTLHNLFEIPPEKVQLEARLVADLDLDSIDAVDMAATLQRSGVKRVPMSDLVRIRTVGDLVDLIEHHMAASESEDSSVPETATATPAAGLPPADAIDERASNAPADSSRT